MGLCDIAEDLVFTNPYFDAPINRHTTPQLDGVVADLRADTTLKVEAQHLKRAFAARAKTLCHGDLRAGSILVTDTDVRVIDPEFRFCGPIGFDIGMLVGNYLMAHQAMPGHICDVAACADHQDWLLDVTRQSRAAFRRLWATERTSIFYPATLYEDQGLTAASERERDDLLAMVFADLLGLRGSRCTGAFSGLPMSRNSTVSKTRSFVRRWRLAACGCGATRTRAGRLTTIDEVLTMAQARSAPEGDKA